MLFFPSHDLWTLVRRLGALLYERDTRDEHAFTEHEPPQGRDRESTQSRTRPARSLPRSPRNQAQTPPTRYLFDRLTSHPDTMNLRPHDDGDGKKVWLSRDDVDALEETASDTEQRIAFELGVRCGLRSAEILEVAPQDVVETDAGWHSLSTHDL